MKRATEEVGDEHEYIDISATWQKSITESAVCHLYPYICIP